jgi:hypothetical protein
MDATDVEESDEVYVTKLALSLGRSEFLLLYVLCPTEHCASHSPPEVRDERLSPRSPPGNVLRRSCQVLRRSPPSYYCQKESRHRT